ncbi:MAG: hypothetical protein MK102_16045 [Fuerstiella sp.]|nr:hypothetical protein [Fuerstiella sp.]
MLNLATFGRTMSAGALLIAFLILSSNQAVARPPYKELYQKVYPELAKAGGVNISCSVCHPFKNKKILNNYGAALKKELGVTNPPKWVKDKNIVTAALKKLENHKSHVEGRTFGNLIRAGNLPGDNNEERASIVYVSGLVLHATKSSCLIDLGTAHTIANQDQLAVFREVHGHFAPIGHVTVTEAEGITSHCSGHIQTQPYDLVIAVREINQLQAGARHRDRIIRQQVVRSFSKLSTTSVNDIKLANALTDYQRQYADWERARGDVVGSIESAMLQNSADESRERLRSQINLMRRKYLENSTFVAAAGPIWSGIMPILSGGTAEADHRLRLQDMKDGNLPNGNVGLTAAEIRDRVLDQDQVFQLQPEQQNIVALIVASLVPGTTSNSTILLRSHIRQTQFPDLNEDEQLLEDVDQLVMNIRDGN